VALPAPRITTKNTPAASPSTTTALLRVRRRRVLRRASSNSTSGSSGARRPGGGAITVTLDLRGYGATITSTIPDFKVNRADPTPLHDQVTGAIRRAIADGEALPGDRLPPAKDLAAVLGVNTNTVLRALRELRDQGLLEFRRGRGITVAGAPSRSAVISQARDLIELAQRHGYHRDELIQIIQDI
jgi:GntR family transcriptional regulator